MHVVHFEVEFLNFDIVLSDGCSRGDCSGMTMTSSILKTFLRHFRPVGSAFLLHHVLADQWVVVIIILIFSTKENMFVEHTENMMMDIFCEFHAVA